MKSFQIGRLQVSFAWAPDFKWDWTSDVGDRHTYFVSFGIVRRPTPVGLFPFLYGTLGPVWISFAWGFVKGAK